VRVSKREGEGESESKGEGEGEGESVLCEPNILSQKNYSLICIALSIPTVRHFIIIRHFLSLFHKNCDELYLLCSIDIDGNRTTLVEDNYMIQEGRHFELKLC
jgi:hypothetical protein